jgi:hypothetical protein
MSELTTQGRKRIAEGNFALPGRRYPIHDRAHARNALARIAQHGTATEKKQVQAAVHSKFPGIGDEKTAGMEKEAVLPFLIPAAAAAIPFLGLLRHNPEGRYNVGGQQFNTFEDLQAAAQPGDVLFSGPLGKSNESFLTSGPGGMALDFGHTDILYKTPQGKTEGVFVPMKMNPLEKGFAIKPPEGQAGPPTLPSHSFALLRPTATPEQRARLGTELANYGAASHEFRKHLDAELRNLFPGPLQPGDTEAIQDLSRLFRRNFVSNADIPTTAAAQLVGVNPSLNPTTDPTTSRYHEILGKLKDPQSYAKELVGKVDWTKDPTTYESQIKALANECAMGRCSTPVAHFIQEHAGGLKVDKPLDLVAPRDVLYAKGLQPVGYHIPGLPAGAKPPGYLRDPELQLRGLLGLGLGGAAAAGYGLYRSLFRPPWYQTAWRSLKAGNYGRALKAVKEGAMLALKKLGLA